MAWFPDEKLKIEKSRYKANDKVIYKDKEGNLHNAVVLSVNFKSLNVGYLYCIELENEVNGNKKFLVKEASLSGNNDKKKK
jgi:hypothetical protein